MPGSKASGFKKRRDGSVTMTASENQMMVIGDIIIVAPSPSSSRRDRSRCHARNGKRRCKRALRLRKCSRTSIAGRGWAAKASPAGCSCLVMFEDGFTAVTSRNALRRRKLEGNHRD
jgi:hypothetical protein